MMDPIYAAATRIQNGERSAIQDLADLLRQANEQIIEAYIRNAAEAVVMAWIMRPGNKADDLAPIGEAIIDARNRASA